MAATTTIPSAVAPGEFQAELVKMDEGVRTTLAAGIALAINGMTVDQAAIDATLQGWIATFKAVETAKAAYQAAVTARLAITVEARTYFKALKAAIKQSYGAQSPLLASFGINVDKPVVTPTKTKLVAAVRSSQTRAIRGTKGKNQRAAIVVVGNPPVSVAPDGTVESGPPTVNVPTASSPSGNTSVSTPASSAAAVPTLAPAGSGPGNTTPTTGGGTPTGK